MNIFLQIIIFFYIYAFLGWCVEVAFVAVTRGEVVNRGFLNGPVCPIYGVGMVAIINALEPLKGNGIVLFIGGVVICTVLELFTGWILDKIFHMRWWDYTENKFNIGGYVCLEFSIMWGLGSVMMVSLVHPVIEGIVFKIPHILVYIMLVVVTIAFVVDMIVTLKSIIGFKKSLGQLDKMAEGLQQIGDQLKDVVGNSAITVSEKTEESKTKIAESTAETREKIVEATADTRDKIAEATAETREKWSEATAETRGKITEATEKIVEATAETRDKIIEATTGTKEKLASVTAGTIGKLVPNNAEADNSKTKNDEPTAYELKIVELRKQKLELEARYQAMLVKAQRQSKHQIKAFPKFRVSGSSESIKDKLSRLKTQHKD